MSSKIPAILDALAARLATVPGVTSVYRALEGAPLPAEDAGDLPAIYLRLLSDTVEDTQAGKAKIANQIAAELFFVPSDNEPIDNQAVAWAWQIRHALNIADPRALSASLRDNPGIGIEIQSASYHYPQQPSEIASVRQPLVLRCIENY
jgi:hypothetical protein